MSQITRFIGTDPNGTQSSMAKVIVSSAGFLSIANLPYDEKYTFRFWVKTSAIVNGIALQKDDTIIENIASTTSWQKITAKFEGTTGQDVKFYLPQGTYYFWHSKLEVGTMESDYSQSQKDFELQVVETRLELNSRINQTAESITHEVTRAKNAEENLSSKVEQTAESITSTVAKSVKNYDETNININIYGFGEPQSSYPANVDYNNKYYLDQTTGMAYKCVYSQEDEDYVWMTYIQLPTIQDSTISEIEQTAESITSTVAKTQTMWLEEHPVGTPVNIKYKSYGNPEEDINVETTPYPNATINDLYLNVNTGMVYSLSDITTISETEFEYTWDYEYTLISQKSDIQSKIAQTAESITSTIAQSQTSWLEEYPLGTKITIKYKDYGDPPNGVSTDEFEEMDFRDGDYYLDVNNGKVYSGAVSGGVIGRVALRWTLVTTLNKTNEYFSSSIEQTAQSITSRVSSAQSTWIEEYPVGTPVTIKYRGYEAPQQYDNQNVLYPNAAINDLYLNMNDGKVYKITNIEDEVIIVQPRVAKVVEKYTWTYQYTLESQTEEIYSQIEQTAESITSTVAGYQTAWDEESYYIKWKEYGVVESIQVTHGSSNYPIVYDYYLDVETGLLYRIATVTKDTDASNYEYDYYNITLAQSPIQLKTTRSAIESQIIQLADSITLEVTGGVGNTASIVLKVDGQTQGTGTIDLTGLVTFTDLSTEGQTTINGANIQTGTLSADKITTGTMSCDRLNGGTISGQIISGGTMSGGTIAGTEVYCTSALYMPSVLGKTPVMSVGEEGAVLLDRFNIGNASLGGGTHIYGDPVNGIELLANTTVQGSISATKVYIGSSTIQSVSANCYVGGNNGLNKITGSSIKYKHDFKREFNEDLDPHKLYDVPIYQFKFQTNHLDNEKDIRYDKDVIGFITESLAKHYPIACDYEYDRKTENYKALGWNEKYMIPPMLSLIQEQHKEIESLKDELATLKEQVAFLMQGGQVNG